MLVFYATFNNISVISWRSVLLVEETALPRESHRHGASQWQTSSQNVVSSTSRHERDLSSQRKWWSALIAHVYPSTTCIQSRPQRPHINIAIWVISCDDCYRSLWIKQDVDKIHTLWYRNQTFSSLDRYKYTLVVYGYSSDGIWGGAMRGYQRDRVRMRSQKWRHRKWEGDNFPLFLNPYFPRFCTRISRVFPGTSLDYRYKQWNCESNLYRVISAITPYVKPFSPPELCSQPWLIDSVSVVLLISFSS